MRIPKSYNRVGETNNLFIMKKIKMITVAILAGLMCIACTPKKEKLLCAYEEACQKGDAIAAMKVISEMEKEFGSMEALDSVYTGADQTRLEAATAILEQKVAQQAMEQLNGTMEQVNKARKGYSFDDEDDDE